MTDHDPQQSRRSAARRTALWMAATALGVYALFIYMTARGG